MGEKIYPEKLHIQRTLYWDPSTVNNRFYIAHAHNVPFKGRTYLFCCIHSMAEIWDSPQMKI